MAQTINADDGSVSGSAGLKSSSDGTAVLTLQTKGTNALTLDASQNMGLGTALPGVPFEVKKDGVVATGNWYNIAKIYDASGNKGLQLGYDNTSQTTILAASTSSAASTMAFYTYSGSAWAERARITSGGSFQIGSSSGTDPRLLVYDNDSTDTAILVRQDGAAPVQIWQGSGGTELARITSGGSFFLGRATAISGNTERMSVESTGNSPAIIAKSASGAADNTMSVWNAVTTGDPLFLQFYTEATATSRGSITYNRGAGQVAYNVTSDVRLKDNIANAADAGGKVDALQVRQFDWKETGNHVDYGFVAQELDAVVPHAVNKPEDEEAMWSVDYSKLVPMLVKEIQSLRARVAALEGA